MIMAYSRSVFREVTTVLIFTADTLANGIVILVLTIAYDYCVLGLLTLRISFGIGIKQNIQSNLFV